MSVIPFTPPPQDNQGDNRWIEAFKGAVDSLLQLMADHGDPDLIRQRREKCSFLLACALNENPEAVAALPATTRAGFKITFFQRLAGDDEAAWSAPSVPL
jgi:hypothetical protein